MIWLPKLRMESIPASSRNTFEAEEARLGQRLSVLLSGYSLDKSYAQDSSLKYSVAKILGPFVFTVLLVKLLQR